MTSFGFGFINFGRICQHEESWFIEALDDCELLDYLYLKFLKLKLLEMKLK